MPKTLEELAVMLAKRDKISIDEARRMIKSAQVDMEYAFYNGSLDSAEDILREDLGLEPDYLELFIW